VVETPFEKLTLARGSPLQQSRRGGSELVAVRRTVRPRRALRRRLDNQYRGPDPEAHGAVIGVSPHSAVGYRPWFRVSCAYTSGFFGLAVLEELNR
jgi:hypothetical protein